MRRPPLCPAHLPVYDRGSRSVTTRCEEKSKLPPSAFPGVWKSVREPNAQPAPATGLIKGFGVRPQQAEKETSGGNAGSLFRAFVGTNALLAKDVFLNQKS